MTTVVETGCMNNMLFVAFFLLRPALLQLFLLLYITRCVCIVLMNSCYAAIFCFRRPVPFMGQPDYRIHELNRRLQQRTEVVNSS